MRQSAIPLLIFAALAANPVFSQTGWEAGVLGGGANYLGDLSERWYPVMAETNLGYGAYLKRHFSANLSARVQYLGGRLSGNDSNFDTRFARQFSFKTTFHEVSLLGEFDFGGKKRFSNGIFRPVVSPYLFAGPAVSKFSVSNDYHDQPDPNPMVGSEKIAQDRAADKSQPAIALVAGGGVRYDINHRLNIGLELGVRPALSDLIDGVSKSGNPDRNDWYLFGGLSLGFKMLHFEADADQDGISDRDDQCPRQAGLRQFQGCPDRDNDGIVDEQDVCPDYPGTAAFKGCPDTDKDGLPDIEDQCPDLPGDAAMHGCPDRDGDRVPDQRDACPELPGSAEMRGCPDTDGDGVADPLDKCPRQPGIAAFEGCPSPDADNDGVPDAADRCPDMAGPAATKGCPEIKKEEREAVNLAVRNIQFVSNSAQLTPESLPLLDQVAALLKKYPNYRVHISGHTDNAGRDAPNMALSEHRAESCRNYLVSVGLDPGRVSFEGFGETKPIAPNGTAEGRRLNRRVEFDFQPL